MLAPSPAAPLRRPGGGRLRGAAGACLPACPAPPCTVWCPGVCGSPLSRRAPPVRAWVPRARRPVGSCRKKNPALSSFETFQDGPARPPVPGTGSMVWCHLQCFCHHPQCSPAPRALGSTPLLLPSWDPGALGRAVLPFLWRLFVTLHLQVSRSHLAGGQPWPVTYSGAVEPGVVCVCGGGQLMGFASAEPLLGQDILDYRQRMLSTSGRDGPGNTPALCHLTYTPNTLLSLLSPPHLLTPNPHLHPP